MLFPFSIQKHFDWLWTLFVPTLHSALGFPPEACEVLRNHEAKMKSEHSGDPRWFSAAANYLSATKQALQCKLEACSYMMRQGQSGNLQSTAVELLLNPDDAMALSHGITCVAKEGLKDDTSTLTSWKP
jgi:hypothetical protein